MLVLSRKQGEKLIIDGKIIVTVNRVSGNRITLGIEAPQDIRIVRGELEPLEQELPEQEGTAGRAYATLHSAGFSEGSVIARVTS